MSNFDSSKILTAGSEGADISKWQGTINWEAVAFAKEIQFCYIKATEGDTTRDSMYRRNMAQAHDFAPSIQLGGYHFARVSGAKDFEADAKAEATNFANNLREYQSCWTLTPMLDLEWDERTTHIPATDIIRWAKVFCAEVELKLLTPCGIYTQASFWKYKLAQTHELRNQPLWLAGATQIPNWPPMLNQYTSKGTVAGINGHVDLDRWCDHAQPPKSPGMLTALLTNILAKAAGTPKRGSGE